MRSLVQLMGGSIRIVEKNGPGAVFQFSICFQRATSCETIPFSLSPSYQGTEIIVGIPDTDCRVVACEWITKLGLNVHQVESWEQILLYMRALNGGSNLGKRTGFFENLLSDSSDDLQKLTSISEAVPRRTSWSHRYEFWRSWKDSNERPLTGKIKQLMILDTSLLPSDVKADVLEEYLQESGFLTSSSTRCLDGLGVSSKVDLNDRTRRDLQGDLSVVWVCASNVHEPIKAALRAVRNSFIVRRPLHTARLKEIFHLVSEGDILPLPEVQHPPELLAANIINYAKQQEWHDPYACDTEVPLAQEPLRRPTVSSVLQLGRNVRHRPTATKSFPTEEISYSEMEIRPSPQINEPTSQSSTATATKPIRRNIQALAQLNGRKNGNAPKPLEKLEILVAEDTPLLRKLAVAMLKRLGAVTYEASNGQEVLDAVKTRMQNGQAPYHCILMDCQVISYILFSSALV